MKRLSYDLVVALYRRGIHRGVLEDRGKLEAAIAAPFSGFGDVEFFPTLDEKAARLTFGICQAHAYSDGNKGLAWLCCDLFYKINGWALEADQDDAADVILDVARGARGYEGLLAWLIGCDRRPYADRLADPPDPWPDVPF